MDDRLSPSNPATDPRSDPRTDPRRPGTVKWLVGLLVFQGIGAIGGGAVLVASPDGSLMHMPLTGVRDSVFKDFLVPGLYLLIVLGILPLVAATGMWRRRRWGWYASVVVGLGLMVFEVVEVLIIPFSPLQPFYFVVGLVLLGLPFARSVRTYSDAPV